MKTDASLRPKPGDFILTGIIALIAVAMILFLFFHTGSTEAGSAIVYQDGSLLRTLDLTLDTEFTVTGQYTNTITVHSGRVAVTQSTCPNKDCVYCGWQSRPGQSIVCLPNRLEIVLSGESDVDAFTR